MRRILLPLLLTCWLITSAAALDREPLQGPLADYVAAPDDSYEWAKRTEGTIRGCLYVELTLTSQTWRDIVWRHQLFIIKPPTVREEAKHGLLFIAGGSWRDELADPNTQVNLPREAELLALAALQFKTPIAILLHVPQQPIFDGKKEDEIIAYTFDEFLKTKDGTWPLLAPMVKSAVRAMDAISQASKKEWGLEVEKFTVTGASKRGWTTWLTGAVDDRVVAIAPMVIDMLNLSEQIALQKATFGDLSEQVADYKERNLDEYINTPAGKALRQIVDPWEYRQRLTQPKLVILGTNDAYWPLDAASLYFNELPGEKHLLYIPNNGHGLPDRARVIAGLNAIHQRVITGKPLPKLSWKFDNGGALAKIRVETDVSASRMVVWSAMAPTRDFRKAKWSSRAIGEPSANPGLHWAAATQPQPVKGYAAQFIEAVFHEGTEQEFSLTTAVQIVPHAAAVGGK
jgi:PhoPQ-activated pathogenicity-related protein